MALAGPARPEGCGPLVCRSPDGCFGCVTQSLRGARNIDHRQPLGYGPGRYVQVSPSHSETVMKREARCAAQQQSRHCLRNGKWVRFLNMPLCIAREGQKARD